MTAVRQELATERQRFEAAAAELARAQVRLEVLPTLQAEIEQLRATLRADAEHSAQALASCQQARQLAEQGVAVLTARLEAAERRANEADARTEKADARADALAYDLAGVNAALQASHVRLEAAAREVGVAEAAARKSAEELAEFKRPAADVVAKPAVAKSAKAGKGEQGALKL